MIDSSCEVDLGGFEGIVGGEVNGEKEEATLEWTVALCAS